MILLAGLTPAWQHTLVFDAFTPGQVNRAREVYWNASGKVLTRRRPCGGSGATAWRSLRWAGRPSRRSTAIRLAGHPPPVDCDRVVYPRVYDDPRPLPRHDDRTGRNGRPLAPAELEAYLAAYAEEAARADVAVVSGSLPLCTPDGYYRELVRRTPCPVVLDFRGPGLLGVLDLKPLVVKPNRQELAETLGRPLGTDDELRSAMRELNRRGAQWVIVTQGSGPVWLIRPRASTGFSRRRSPTSSTHSAAATPWPPRSPGQSTKAATYPKPSASASPPRRTTSATSCPAVRARCRVPIGRAGSGVAVMPKASTDLSG